MKRDNIVDQEGDFVLVHLRKSGLLGIKNLSCTAPITYSQPWVNCESCGCETLLPRRLIRKRNKVNNVLRKYHVI